MSSWNQRSLVHVSPKELKHNQPLKIGSKLISIIIHWDLTLLNNYQTAMPLDFTDNLHNSWWDHFQLSSLVSELLLVVVECSVAYLALSKGGCKIFGKRHSHKMIKFILIIYFHGTKYYQSIFLFLKNVRNIYYTYYTTLHYIIHNIYIYNL